MALVDRALGTSVKICMQKSQFNVFLGFFRISGTLHYKWDGNLLLGKISDCTIFASVST